MLVFNFRGRLSGYGQTRGTDFSCHEATYPLGSRRTWVGSGQGGVSVVPYVVGFWAGRGVRSSVRGLVLGSLGRAGVRSSVRPLEMAAMMTSIPTRLNE